MMCYHSNYKQILLFKDFCHCIKNNKNQATAFIESLKINLTKLYRKIEKRSSSHILTL